MRNIIISESVFLNVDKAFISDLSNKYVVRINDGHTDAVEALILSKKIQELGKTLESKVRPIAESTQTVGKGGLVKYNASIEERETGVKYDFSTCKDSEWESLDAQLKSISAQMKDREKFLKSLTKPVADPDTGEIINPPVKSGKLGLVITLK